MKIIKISFIIIGGVIGAGFASGKEIFEYFAKFGCSSLFYIIPLFFIFFLSFKIYLSYGSVHTCFELKTQNNLLAPKFKFYKINFNYLNVFMFFTFLILSSAMYSSIISLFKTYLPMVDWRIIHVAIFLLTYIILNKSLKFLSTITYFVVPLIIIYILINSAFTFGSLNLTTSFGNNNFALPLLTILYASQNTFLCSFITIKSGEKTTKKEQTIISLIVSGILCLLITFSILCFMSLPSICSSEIPFAEIAISISPLFSLIFVIIIFFSIITTYFTTLSSLKEFFNGKKKYNKPIHMLMLIALCSLLNFGTIVEYLYPIIGCFGVIYLFIISKQNKVAFCLNANVS